MALMFLCELYIIIWQSLNETEIQPLFLQKFLRKLLIIVSPSLR